MIEATPNCVAMKRKSGECVLTQTKVSGARLRPDRTAHRYIGDISRAAEFIHQRFGTPRLAAITRAQAKRISMRS